jgi:AcrR family transcriptional regulator
MNTSHTTTTSNNPAPSLRRQRRSSDIRERLFRSSLKLFAQKGFEQTTVEDITNAADVGKGTFFNYFPSKDHILVAYGEMQMGRLRQAVEDARHTNLPLPEFLRNLTTRMNAEPAGNPALTRVLLLSYISNGSVRQSMLEMQERKLDLIGELIAIGQQRGEIRADIPARELALVFRQTVFGTLLVWSLYGDDSLKCRMNSAFDIIWTGIEPRTSPAPEFVPGNFQAPEPVTPLFF